MPSTETEKKLAPSGRRVVLEFELDARLSGSDMDEMDRARDIAVRISRFFPDCNVRLGGVHEVVKSLRRIV